MWYLCGIYLKILDSFVSEFSQTDIRSWFLPRMVIVNLPTANRPYFLKITRRTYEAKRDNRLRKTRCIRAFFHFSRPSPSRGTPKISRKHPHTRISNNEKACVYILRLIIMARSTVEAYSEGYAWARTNENARDREGVKVVMGSIESEDPICPI